MKSFIFPLILSGLILSCDSDVTTEDAIRNLTATAETISADGQSTIDVTVELNNSASSDRRNIIFKTTSGSFTTSGKSQETVKATYDNGKLTATTTLLAPIVPGDITVTAEPEFDSPIKEFKLTKTIQATASVPSTIKLSASAVGIASNFVNEVQLTGLILNSDKKWASKGTKVDFDDFLINGDPANGLFRVSNDLSDASSMVSASYGASDWPVGTEIRIKATVIDADGKKTTIIDSVTLAINK